MKKRKTIAILVGTPDGFFRNKALNGIIKQAKSLDYNVAVFSVFTLSDDGSKHQQGENNLYRLITECDIAGAVLVDYSFWASSVKKFIYDLVKSIPGFNMVVIDNTDIEGFKGICPNDRKNFRKMTDHLIEVHGFKKIYCLTGMEEYSVSHDRLNGYKDSMRAHGLEWKDEWCIFGDFWIQRATLLAEEIASGKIERPEAVVCANDKSAITLVNELILRDIKVPEDIAVVGYDFDSEAITNDPALTTCTRPDLYNGEKCVCRLHYNLTGELIEPLDPETGFFVSGESCGCRRDVSFAREYNEYVHREQASKNSFRFAYMQEFLMASESYDELITNISSRFYLIYGISTFVLALNRDWNLFRENDKEYIRDGYSREMFEAIAWKEGEIIRNVPFSPRDLFPPDILLEERPVACFFNAVHFEDRCLGYQVVRFKDDENVFPEDIYHSWSSSVSVSLEYIRMQERMKLMYNRAFSNSVRDGMTGLYNRQGYELYADEVFRSARARKQRLLIVVADLDDLKMINDNFGHSEGDNAINVCARALQTCCGNGEYCVRSGGDEFIVMGSYDYDEATPIFYRSRIDGYLARYNASSDKPYKIGMSAGFFLEYTDDYGCIDQCLKIADERMYSDKIIRKKGRR